MRALTRAADEAVRVLKMEARNYVDHEDGKERPQPRARRLLEVAAKLERALARAVIASAVRR